jgi:hypothetical protein
MTNTAVHPAADMGLVIEENVIRQRIHPPPCHFLSLGIGPAQGFKHLRVGKNLRVTLHADGGRGKSGMPGPLHLHVAKPAIDLKTLNVMNVTERDGLFDEPVLLRHPRRTRDHAVTPKDQHASANKKKQKETHSVCQVKIRFAHIFE